MVNACRLARAKTGRQANTLLPCATGVLMTGMRTYTTPMMAVMFVAMIVIAWLADITWWMIAIGAVLAVVGYLLERRKDD